jgi:hypothetical protein
MPQVDMATAMLRSSGKIEVMLLLGKIHAAGSRIKRG